jgi:hypothetical protein
VMRKSRLPKCTCAPRVQLTPWLAIRGLGVDVKTRKRPLPGTATVGVSYHQLVNLDYAFWPGWCARVHKDLYYFWQNIPTSSSRWLVLLVLKFVVGVTNGRERDEVPSL